MPVLSGVGRGTRAMSFTAKPPSVSRCPYSSGVGKNQGAIGAAAGADGADRRSDRRDIAVPAELADEAAARAKRAGDAGDDQSRFSHPVERGIGEDRVELGDEIERVAVNLAHGEPLHARHR